MSEDRWLCTKEVAQILGFSVRTLMRWRARGTGPRYAVIGRSVRYRPRDVEAWLQRRLVGEHQNARKLQ